MALSFCESVGYSISENSTQGVVFGRNWTRCLVVREWSVLRTDWRFASGRTLPVTGRTLTCVGINFLLVPGFLRTA